jgi:cold shock CspA family protein
MELGFVQKKNNELRYGFVEVSKGRRVFFSGQTQFAEPISFDKLEVGDRVEVEVTDTERGLFATSLSSAVQSPKIPGKPVVAPVQL